jgi:predicted signal transduction protein with EAL and GGDEF domain
LGGDEFGVLHVDESESWLPQEMSSTLLGAFRETFRVADVELGIRTSIGVAHVNAHNAMGPDELIRSADLALYRAKAEGGGAMTFDPAMNARAQRRHELNQALGQAIERDQLSLCFQPIVEIETGLPVCFEALLRWSTPEFGSVSPAEFIAIAEETGQITTIGRWVLERAIEYAATWPGGTGVAVNLSAIQFRDQALPDLIRDVVRRHGFDLSRLELEITESTYLDAGDARRSALQALRSAGATISLDDFGTGYSSLSYLHNLPFNKLKIDKAFVRSSLVGADSHALLRSIIDIGHNFGMTVVAEGVEEPAQLEILRNHRCDQIQGYLISRPIPAEAVSSFLSGGSPSIDFAPVRDANAA